MKMDAGVIDLWNKLYSLQMIADVYDVSRVGVKKYLNRHGIDTGKRKWDATCNECGVVFKKPRCQIRNSRFQYCTTACYSKSMENPDYFYSRQGQHKARESVRGCGYYLVDGEVVHHKDGDTTNNDPNNLMVFASQSDHMRWHRGDRSLVTPLWGDVPGKPPPKAKVVRAEVIADLKEAILRPGKPEACVECCAPFGHRTGCSLEKEA